MEDFGYQKDGENRQFPDLVKRAFLVGATLFSIACFVYITINAYYFVYQDKNADIETIKSPEGPIKVFEEEQNAQDDSMQIDRSIYEDIFGNKKHAQKQVNPTIRNAPEPALPPKQVEMDRRLIKETEPMVDEVKEVKKPTTAQEQKLIVYSDQAKKEKPSQDLLTNTKGERAVAQQPVKPVTPPAFEKKRAVRVQVAAMTSSNAADEQWNKLNRLYPSLFSGLRSYTEEVNLGKRGIFFRLQIGNFYNQIDAEEFCNRYVAQTKKSKADCIVVE